MESNQSLIRLVVSFKSIALKYFKGYFLLDFICSFPFTYVFPNSEGGASKLFRFGRIPRLLRVTRIVKIFKFSEVLKSSYFAHYFRVKGGLINVTLLLLFTLTTMHLANCIWCFIGLSEEQPIGWIDRYKLRDLSLGQIYLKGFYFCLVSLATVGYGDITPYTECI